MKITGKAQKLEVKPVDAALLRRIGGEAIAVQRRRIVERHQGSNDAAMKPYATRGPIYVPLTGKGRSKTSLGGRQVLTPRALTAAKKEGRVAAKTPSKKSVKFENYAAYKRFLGKSGNRDLELSGDMLRGMTIVRQDANSITIGFTREDARKKAEGNEKRVPWFQLSPADQKAVIEAFEKAYGVPVRVAG